MNILHNRHGQGHSGTGRAMRLLLKGAMAASLVGLVSGAASATDYKMDGTFPWVAKGEMLQIGEQRFYWVGAYSGMFVAADPANPLDGAALVCPGFNEVGVANGGYCQDILDKDNILYVQYQGDGQYPAGKGSFKYIGGTGKFAGATGGGDFTFVFAKAPNPDGTQAGNSTFHNVVLTLP